MRAPARLRLTRLHCPFCQATDTRVIDSRLTGDGLQIRRRRECAECNTRFNTFETPAVRLPAIVKGDGRREAFNADKLRSGVERALQKRPVSTQAVEEAINTILRELRSTGEEEVDSRVVGELVMRELKRIDEVAYVRFASVYRRFEDVQAFREEIERLERELPVDAAQLSLLAQSGRRK